MSVEPVVLTPPVDPATIPALDIAEALSAAWRWSSDPSESSGESRRFTFREALRSRGFELSRTAADRLFAILDLGLELCLLGGGDAG